VTNQREHRSAIAKPPRFVWPPRPVTPAPTATLHAAEVVRGPELARTWRTALQEALDDTRRIWLDMTLPRLDERLAECAFVPDTAAAYCPKCGLGFEAGDSHDPHDPSDTCLRCAGKRPPWARVVRIGTYTPPLADVIRQIKFSRWRRLGRDLGLFLGEQVAAQLPTPRPPVMLVPVPMSWRRRLFRGMDHSLAICRGVRDGLGGDARIVQLLARRHGPSQLAVLPSDRAGNVGRLIRPRLGACRSVPPDAVIVVIDDVMTTGATMRAACRAVRAGLKAIGAGRREVWAAVAARTELPDGDRDEGGDEG